MTIKEIFASLLVTKLTAKTTPSSISRYDVKDLMAYSFDRHFIQDVEAAEFYDKGFVVRYLNDFYVSMVDITPGNLISDPTKWQKLSKSLSFVPLVITINGQTVFTLAYAPAEPNSALLVVNGQTLRASTSFVIVGNILTYLNPDFPLEIQDEAYVIYN